VRGVSGNPGLHLHTSNRLEALFAGLAEIVRPPSGHIFRKETIVVQSIGMGRWLSLRLAETQGICANVVFPFPQKFIGEVLQNTLPEKPAHPAYEREVMAWRIARLLPGLLAREEFAPVGRYLAGERAALKLYQLSNRIAETFDRYLAFRPGWILDWDAGNESHWQATLWRALSAEFPGSHLPALGQKLASALRKQGDLAHLPARVSIFGLSTLPKFYLDLIEAIATRTQVHLFVMEPTPEWWHDIVSAKKEAKIIREKPGQTPADLHLERGNDLLAAMGKLGREFLGLVGALEPVAQHESFVEPEGKTRLATVQREIFHLQERAVRAKALPDDRSIQFHSCHSLMREMEVLHDQLLDLFAKHPALEPRDVIVMMPDVGTYAPYIDAVFDTPEEEALRIPYTIADRTARAESGAVDTFLAILELAGSRFGASSVLNILESPSVLRRFDLAEADLETIRVWLDRAAIRWGIDAEHRAQFDVPAFSQNTWREGLDRLLLGYALPARGDRLFHGLLPIDEIEGNYAETLGNLVEFSDALFHAAAELKAPRSLVEWQPILRRIVERFFVPDDDSAHELLLIRHAIDSLGKVAQEANFEEQVPFDVLLAHLQRILGEAEASAGFLVGHVTFCALKPMRSIPFKVVCLVGMDDNAYPRKSNPPGFDLIARQPKPGDRTVRDDDRYLFLEALLSAREFFYVSYVGQSLKDGSALPPSVLVSELLDYLGEEEDHSLVTRHRLQPFNADYFLGESALFSYSRDNCRASEVARRPRIPPRPFLAEPIAEPDEEWRHVELESLAAFFRNPAQYFIQQRLGLKFPNERPQLEEREPFELGPLTNFKIEDDLLRKKLDGVPLAEAEGLLRAGGQFPPGHTGAAVYREKCDEVEKFAALVTDKVGEKYLEPLPVDLTLGPWRVTGRVDELTANGLVRFRLTKLKAKEMLRVWLFHLALNASGKAGSSTLIGRDIMQAFAPVAKKEAAERLRELLEIYWEGLTRPLQFFPQSSYAFAKQSLNSRARTEPLKKAHDAWTSNPPFRRGEEEDDYFDLAFRHLSPDPLDEMMQNLSMRVFRPLIENRKETEVS
jgi:exodeoxyribonuclease V gamma subunit